MSTTQHKLGNSLLKHLINLREQKGEIRIEDVGELLMGMASSLQDDAAPTDTFIRREMERMAQYIVNAKTEITAMIPVPPAEEEDPAEDINAATMELDEVVKATEHATNNIMDAADTIQDVASGLEDNNASGKIMDETMKIYDACSFQDITGQRISKVIRTLEQVEDSVVRLVQLFGGTLPEGYEPKEREHVERADEHLMSGPQMTNDMPSQEDIDKLFDNM